MNISAILPIGGNLRLRSQIFQLATLVGTIYRRMCDASIFPLPCRLRQSRFGAHLSSSAPDDVLHEHGQPVSN